LIHSNIVQLKTKGSFHRTATLTALRSHSLNPYAKVPMRKNRKKEKAEPGSPRGPSNSSSSSHSADKALILLAQLEVAADERNKASAIPVAPIGNAPPPELKSTELKAFRVPRSSTTADRVTETVETDTSLKNSKRSKRNKKAKSSDKSRRRSGHATTPRAPNHASSTAIQRMDPNARQRWAKEQGRKMGLGLNVGGAKLVGELVRVLDQSHKYGDARKSPTALQSNGQSTEATALVSPRWERYFVNNSPSDQ
jgi:hypothetical protein